MSEFHECSEIIEFPVWQQLNRF